MVLCHSTRLKDDTIEGWNWIKEVSEGAGWGMFARREKQEYRSVEGQKKTVKEYYYRSRQDKTLMKVRKTRQGDKKDFNQFHSQENEWIAGCCPNRNDIPIYNYYMVQKAIGRGETIFWVEGEGCADALAALGIVATTSIGGSSGLGSYGDYLEDIEGASIILCPDKDKAGVAYMDKVAALAGDRVVGWCYAFDNGLWSHLPANNGADLEDEINEKKLTKDDILARITERRQLDPTPKTNHPKADPPPAVGEVDRLIAEVDRLIVEGTYNSRLRAEWTVLAKKYGQTVGNIQALYDERLNDAHFADDRQEIDRDIHQLLSADRTRLQISELLPKQVAGAINMRAALLGLMSENYLFAVLAAVSCCQKAETRIEISKRMGWSEPPIINAAIVAESSQRKTPILKDTIYLPFRRLEQKEAQDYDQAYNQYEIDCDRYTATKPKDRADGGMTRPTAPVPRLHLLSDISMEGAISQSCAHPNTPLLYVRDELSGIFGDINKYRGGRGSDRQVLLEAFNGAAIRSVRAGGKTLIHNNFLMGMFGGIQPEVLQRLMGEGDDADGLWGRFLFTIQPTVAAPSMPDRGGEVVNDLPELLGEIYERIDDLPDLTYQLSDDAYNLFRQYRDILETERVNQTNAPAIRHLAGKLQGITARIALNLHTFWWAANPKGAIATEIDLTTMARAIEIADYALAQARLLSAQYSPFTGTSGKIHKMLQVIKDQGVATIRDIQRRVERASADAARCLIEQAISLGFVRWKDRKSIEIADPTVRPVTQPPTPQPPKIDRDPPVPDRSTPSGGGKSKKSEPIDSPAAVAVAKKIPPDPKPRDRVVQYAFNKSGQFVPIRSMIIMPRPVHNGWAVACGEFDRSEWGVTWFPEGWQHD